MTLWKRQDLRIKGKSCDKLKLQILQEIPRAISLDWRLDQESGAADLFPVQADSVGEGLKQSTIQLSFGGCFLDTPFYHGFKKALQLNKGELQLTCCLFS